MVRLQGEAILSHLGTIDNLKDSELETYLQKLLKSGVSKEKDASSKLPIDQQIPEKKEGASKTRRLSKTTQETLTAIFRKIGSKEQSQEVFIFCTYLFKLNALKCLNLRLYHLRDCLNCMNSNSAIPMPILNLS